MAHARRKFDKALDNDKSRAEHALKLFQNYEQIKQLRQEKSLPVLQDMEQWLNEEIIHVVPKSVIGQAISYTINLWPRLRRYVEQGRFSIDNNPIKNSARTICLQGLTKEPKMQQCCHLQNQQMWNPTPG